MTNNVDELRRQMRADPYLISAMEELEGFRRYAPEPNSIGLELHLTPDTFEWTLPPESREAG